LRCDATDCHSDSVYIADAAVQFDKPYAAPSPIDLREFIVRRVFAKRDTFGLECILDQGVEIGCHDSVDYASMS
jgi:hypothetical protein